MRYCRAFVLAICAVVSLSTAVPAWAQVMPSQGIPIPWFHSPAERIQRDACRRNLPECRSSVRAQLEFEESITVILPWVALAIAILGVLFWLRRQEREREKRKRLARMHHTPGAFKKLDASKEEKDKEEDEDADRLSF